MFKIVRYYPEIQDLWVLPSRRVFSALKYGVIILVHVILFKLMLSTGKIEPYASYQESKLNKENEIQNYDFSKLGKTFLPWNYYRVEEMPEEKLEELLISSVPKKLKPRMQKILRHTLDLCEYYQLDPLWVLSIMWTESHFNPQAKSVVNANGLMQIMPNTAHFLLKLMNRPMPKKKARLLTNDSFKNIDMGTFYLRRLFILFNFDFKYATIAYNMGQNGVLRKLRAGRSVGQNHLYLKKVKRHYLLLLKPIKSYLTQTPAPYMKTLVVHNKWRFIPETPEILQDFPLKKLVAQSSNSSQRLEL